MDVECVDIKQFTRLPNHRTFQLVHSMCLRKDNFTILVNTPSSQAITQWKFSASVHNSGSYQYT